MEEQAFHGNRLRRGGALTISAARAVYEPLAPIERPRLATCFTAHIRLARSGVNADAEMKTAPPCHKVRPFTSPRGDYYGLC